MNKKRVESTASSPREEQPAHRGAQPRCPWTGARAGLALWLILVGSLSPSGLRAAGPARIAVASPDIAVIVRELDAADKVAAADAHSIAMLARITQPTAMDPAGADVFATLRDARVELVLGDAAALPPERVRQLRERGMQAVAFQPRTLDELFAAYREIGRLIGRADAAERLVRRISRELAALSAAVLHRPRPRVALVLGLEPITVPPGYSLVTDIIEIAGGETVLEHIRSPNTALTPEALAARAPQVVVHALTRGDTAPDTASAAAWWREHLGPVHVAFMDRELLERWSALTEAVRHVQALLFVD